MGRVYEEHHFTCSIGKCAATLELVVIHSQFNYSSACWLMCNSLSSQESETTDQCAARLKARLTGSGDTNDGWSSLDVLVCVDSTWQQATSIMKVKSVSTKLVGD